MKNLTATTPVGTFTRKTDTAYTHVNVWASPRAMAAFESAGTRTRRACGVDARWIKDRGYGVTWHKSEANARAVKGYTWDNATLVGTFAVGV